MIGYANLQTTSDPAARRRIWHALDAGLQAGTLAPVIDRTFDFEEFADAHRHLESNGQIGKIVVTVRR